MPDSAFVARLNEQIANEFAAHQQYVANAVHYDAETLPRLAAFFYAQAVEERNHAMMMVQYLLDADAEVSVPGIGAPKTAFSGLAEPVRLALDQEKRVSDQIAELARLARDGGDCSPSSSCSGSSRSRSRRSRRCRRCSRWSSARATGPWTWRSTWSGRTQRRGRRSTAPPAAGGAL